METKLSKGIFYLIIGTFLFNIFGLLMNFGLGRLLGPEKFGIYGVVISLAVMLSLIICTALDQTVTKFVSENNQNAESIKRKVLTFQIFVGTSIFILYFVFAGFIAFLLKDNTIINLIRISGLLFIFYPFYSVYKGYLSGQKRFKENAILIGIYSILKLLLVLGFVIIGWSIIGAIFGFVTATALMLIICMIWFGVGRKDRNLSIKNMIVFGMPLLGFHVVMLLLSNVSLFFVKSLSNINIANIQAGYYTASITIANILPTLINPIKDALFPFISESYSKNKGLETSYYSKSAIRYALIALVPLIAIISSTSYELMKLIYSSEYEKSGDVMAALIIAMGFFGLYSLISTIIIGLGKPKTATKIAFFVILIMIIGNLLLVPRLSAYGAAISSSLSLFFGLIISSLYLYKINAGLPNILSFIRILTTGFVVYFISKMFIVSGIMLLFKYLFLIILYAIILLLIKELKKEDLLFIKTAITR